MGDLFGGGAAKAAKIAAQTADKNNALAQSIYSQNKSNLDPTISRGDKAGSAYNALLGLGGDQAGANTAFDNYQKSSGYQFRLGQGESAINAGAFARGGGLSGATLKAANDYAQNSASGEFGNYLGQLDNQQRVGLTGSSALAGVGQNLVSNVSANNNTASSAAQNAALAQGSTFGKLIGAGLNIASSFVPGGGVASKILGAL